MPRTTAAASASVGPPATRTGGASSRRTVTCRSTGGLRTRSCTPPRTGSSAPTSDPPSSWEAGTSTLPCCTSEDGRGGGLSSQPVFLYVCAVRPRPLRRKMCVRLRVWVCPGPLPLKDRVRRFRPEKFYLRAVTGLGVKAFSSLFPDPHTALAPAGGRRYRHTATARAAQGPCTAPSS